MPRFLYCFLFLIIMLASCKVNKVRQSDKEPFNVILILADDLGYGDLGYMGASDIETPNIDQLAKEGIVFTDFYAPSPVCSPSRAGLLTGRYPDKVGIKGVLRKHHDATHGLDTSELTIAEVFKNNGYATGLIGKWHLGISERYRPAKHGFDYSYGPLNGTIDYYTHIGGGGMDGAHNLFLNNEEVFDTGYVTDLFHEQAFQFIDTNKNNPFFLFLSHTTPHYPLQAPDSLIAHFDTICENPNRAKYAAMIKVMDMGIGALVQQLKLEHLYDKTVIIFTSDHGQVMNNDKQREITTNGILGRKGLQYGKYHLTEGGLRVPFIMRIPKETPRTISTPGISLDIFPTLLALNHIKLAKNDFKQLDGIDLFGEMKDERSLYWKFSDNFQSSQNQWAIRKGNHKLLYLEKDTFLFDLTKDIAETNNLYDTQKDKVRTLSKLFKKWEDSLPVIIWQSR